jgi:alanine racemase
VGRTGGGGLIRSLFTLDLAAIRANVRRLVDVAAGAEVWAVVKADGYGHGSLDVGSAALDAGATALCVASVAEALELRESLPGTRIIVLGPGDVARAREARLELVAGGARVPEGVPVHLKLDTGMGRWGLSELPAPGRDVVGLMSHLASSESDEAFTRLQLERFLAAVTPYPDFTWHIANSAAALALPEARLDAVRCGIAVYGISPFGDRPDTYGLVPALRWTSQLARVLQLQPGESTGYGRTFVATEPTWIGIVPVGYADGFRRDMTGTEVLVAGGRCRVVGTVSMDALAVRLDREVPLGEEVVLLGDGITAEAHARTAGTIGYEIVCGLNMREPRARKDVVDGR